MSSRQSEHNIKHSWFGHLYIGKPDAVKLTHSGISYHRGKGLFTTQHPVINNTSDEVRFTWQQLDSPPAFIFSPLGYLLSFTVLGKAYQLPYLTYLAHYQFGKNPHFCGLLVMGKVSVSWWPELSAPLQRSICVSLV